MLQRALTAVGILSLVGIVLWLLLAITIPLLLRGSGEYGIARLAMLGWILPRVAVVGVVIAAVWFGYYVFGSHP